MRQLLRAGLPRCAVRFLIEVTIASCTSLTWNVADSGDRCDPGTTSIGGFASVETGSAGFLLHSGRTRSRESIIPCVPYSWSPGMRQALPRRLVIDLLEFNNRFPKCAHSSPSLQNRPALEQLSNKGPTTVVRIRPACLIALGPDFRLRIDQAPPLPRSLHLAFGAPARIAE